jgi:hypothetical protein
MDVAEDVAAGTTDPADLERLAVAELTALVGHVVGPDDALFGLQCEIARGVLAADGIPVHELAEWLAVARHRHQNGLTAAVRDTCPEPQPEASADS